jgi:hypothetical protein
MGERTGGGGEGRTNVAISMEIKNMRRLQSQLLPMALTNDVSDLGEDFVNLSRW